MDDLSFYQSNEAYLILKPVAELFFNKGLSYNYPATVIDMNQDLLPYLKYPLRHEIQETCDPSGLPVVRSIIHIDFWSAAPVLP